MNKTPKISVIMATCKRDSEALECIDSIVNDTFEDFELLIIDQTPRPTLAPEILHRYPEETRIIYHHINKQALSLARNTGIQHARGQILVFIDDDAVVEPGWLQAYHDAFTSIHPAPGVVGGLLAPLWAAQPPAWYPPERMFLLGLYDRGTTLIPMPELELPIGANFASRREVVNQIGLFDERTGFSYSRKTSLIGGEDSLFSMKAKNAGFSLYYQPAAKAKHRIAANKLTRLYFLKRHFWDGYTLLTVMFLSGSATRDGATGIIRWHSDAILRFIKEYILSTRPPDVPRAQAFMLTLAQCANSLGIIRAAIRLRTNELP